MAFIGYMGYHVNKSMKRKKKQALVVPVEQNNVDEVIVPPVVGSPGLVMDEHVSWKVSSRPSREGPTAPPTNRPTLDSIAALEYDRLHPPKITSPEVLAGLLGDSPTLQTLGNERGRMTSGPTLIHFNTIARHHLHHHPHPINYPYLL